MGIAWKKGLFVSFILVLCALAVGVLSVGAQEEVSTKVVGFVKAPMGQGYYFYSIPFKKIGEQDQIHYLNQDADNDGTLDGCSDGIFSTDNFAIGDMVRKFNPATRAFLDPAFLKDINGVIGWYRQVPPFGVYELCDMFITNGEGFLVKFENPPVNPELFFLGEVNDEAVETPIQAGYNLIGNPFPTNIDINDAFKTDVDPLYNPTPGNAPNPFDEGDFVMAGYTGSNWSKSIVYYNHPSEGLGWYEQVPPFGVYQKSTYELKPTEAFMYYARGAFTWKLESPLQEE